MKLVTLSTLYPNVIQQHHGIFVEQRLRHLVAAGDIESKVVAPVPWFPLKSEIFNKYAKYARVPREDTRFNISVLYPRYIVIPKVGMSLTPFLMAMSVGLTLKRIIKNGYDFDLIDAHYFYPDGVAAMILGKIFNKPVVITARGTDLNLIPRYKIPKRLIKWAAANAAALITVCTALKDVLVGLGIPADKVSVLRNGVDLDMFRPPEDRNAIRKKLGINRRTILSVGHLIPRKGHDLVIEILERIADLDLIIIGEGPEDRNLHDLVVKKKLQRRVRFFETVPQEILRDYYGAVDILVLASSREGWANVLLESMACGTPVIATKVWGTPEVVTKAVAGILSDACDVESLSKSVKELFDNYPDRNQTRQYAEKYSWDETTFAQKIIFTKLISG